MQHHIKVSRKTTVCNYSKSSPCNYRAKGLKVILFEKY
jgi:hypothetical protein